MQGPARARISQDEASNFEAERACFSFQPHVPSGPLPRQEPHPGLIPRAAITSGKGTYPTQATRWPNVTPGEDRSNSKSAASTSTKLLLRGVRDSTGSFGLLKLTRFFLVPIADHPKRPKLVPSGITLSYIEFRRNEGRHTLRIRHNIQRFKYTGVAQGMQNIYEYR